MIEIYQSLINETLHVFCAKFFYARLYSMFYQIGSFANRVSLLRCERTLYTSVGGLRYDYGGSRR